MFDFLKWLFDILKSPNVQATVGELIANVLIFAIPELEEYRIPLVGIAGIAYVTFLALFNGFVQPAVVKATGMTYSQLADFRRAQTVPLQPLEQGLNQR